MSEFVLKATPPRLPRAALERAHLRDAWRTHHDRIVFTATAPAGFGKTTLLLQWRRWWLDSGANVAWFTAGQADHPARFALALGHAFRAAGVLDEVAGRRGRGWHLGCLRGPHPTACRNRRTWHAGRPGDRRSGAPARRQRARRAPVPAAQRTGQPARRDRHARRPATAVVGTGRERPVRRGRHPGPAPEAGRIDRDPRDAAWATAFRSTTARTCTMPPKAGRSACNWRSRRSNASPTWNARCAALSARHGTLQEYFVTSLFSRLSPDVAQCLVRASILEHFDTELFQAVTGSRQPRGHARTTGARNTPHGRRRAHEWMRLHPLARDFLLSRFETLPVREQAGLHTRASRWYAERERFHEAATHALAAGDEASRRRMRARSLWALSTSGKLAEAREWLERLPAEMLAGDTELRLVAASVLAVGERNAEAIAIAREVLGEPDITPDRAPSRLRIGAGSSIFADRLGLLPEIIEHWPGPADVWRPPAERARRAEHARHAGAAPRRDRPGACTHRTTGAVRRRRHPAPGPCVRTHDRRAEPPLGRESRARGSRRCSPRCCTPNATAAAA